MTTAAAIRTREWRKTMESITPTALSILWIEDDDGVAHAFTRALQSQPHVTVHRVANLEDAVEALLTGTFNAVLLDLNLPSSRGLETVRRFHELSDLPVVVLTGLMDPGDKMAEEALLLGAQDWLEKASAASTGPELVRSVRMAIARDKYTKAKKSLTHE